MLRPVILAIQLSAILALMLPASIALGEGCRSYNDPHDKFLLGSTPLGDFKSAELKGRLSIEEMEACDDSDCTNDGVGHNAGLIYYVYLLGYPNVIVVESVQLRDGANYKGPLIAGIQIGDSVDVVKKKLKSLPRSFPSWRFYDYANAKWLTMNGCLRGSKSIDSVYKLDFDEAGKLIGVELTGYGADLGD
jgi:hypothetical protein